MKVLLSFDPSSSLPKAIARYPDGSLELFALKPNITECTAGEISRHCKLGINSPDNIWVNYDDRYFALGGLAESISSVDKIRCPKFEKAAVNIMAIAGLVGKKLGCTEFHLDLGILLPFDELGHKEYLNAILRKHLGNFTAAGKKYSITPNWISVAPEGIGCIFQGISCQKPLSQANIFCITIGYRNTSYIHWGSGIIRRGGATDLGFHKCVSLISIAGGLSHVPDERLIPLILAKRLAKKEIEIIGSCQGLDPAIRELEIKTIRKAVADGKAAYLQKIKEWISSLSIPEVDEVIVAGGTARAFRHEIGKFLHGKPVDWRDGLEAELNSIFHNPQLPYRVVDLWGFHKTNQVISKENKVSA
jgi:hypothetical protein